jgi:hypothetical protein
VVLPVVVWPVVVWPVVVWPVVVWVVEDEIGLRLPIPQLRTPASRSL